MELALNLALDRTSDFNSTAFGLRLMAVLEGVEEVHTWRPDEVPPTWRRPLARVEARRELQSSADDTTLDVALVMASRDAAGGALRWLSNSTADKLTKALNYTHQFTSLSPAASYAVYFAAPSPTPPPPSPSPPPVPPAAEWKNSDDTLGHCIGQDGQKTDHQCMYRMGKTPYQDDWKGECFYFLRPGSIVRLKSNIKIPETTSCGKLTVRSMHEGAVLEGDGAARLFDVFSGGELELERITLRKGKAQQGGGVTLRAGASAELAHVLITDCHARSNFGEVRGGGVFAYPNSTVVLTNSRIVGCSAVHEASTGSARGGGIFIMGNATLTNTTITECSARTAVKAEKLGGGEGGGMFVQEDTATVLMRKGTQLKDNNASTKGMNFMAAGGVTTYELPAQPGYWIGARRCEVYRKGCVLNPKSVPYEWYCPEIREECSLQVAEWAYATATVDCDRHICRNPADQSLSVSATGSNQRFLPSFEPAECRTLESCPRRHS